MFPPLLIASFVRAEASGSVARSETAFVHTYAVEFIAKLPQHGTHTFQSVVRLTEQGGPGEEQLFEYVVEREVLVDEHGSVHRIDDHEFDTKRHVFYFRRGPSGAISGVMHHGKELARTLGSKRAMASALQLRLVNGRAANWSGVETDAAGVAHTSYRVLGGSSFLRPHRVVYKRQARFT